MAIDYVQLKADDADGHPVTGAFNVDPQLAADEWNALNIDGPPDSGALLQYLLLERFRTGTLYGRIKMVSDSRPLRAGNAWEFAPLPLGASDADIVPTQNQVAAACAMIRMVDTDTGFAVSLLDSRIDNILNDLSNGGIQAIGPADKTAIQGFSQGVQSHANDLGYGRLSFSNIELARAS